MPEATRHDSKTELFQDAKLIFRNFSGREREFNSEGDRNFSIVIEPERAQQMIKDGWRVKQLKPRPGEEEGDYHLKVTVNYKKGKPPKVKVHTSTSREEWGIDEVGNLDAAEIKKADVLVNGWWSDMAGGGYGGFLKTIFVWLEEDELELMYADIQNPADSKDAEDDSQDIFGEDGADTDLEPVMA